MSFRKLAFPAPVALVAGCCLLIAASGCGDHSAPSDSKNTTDSPSVSVPPGDSTEGGDADKKAGSATVAPASTSGGEESAKPKQRKAPNPEADTALFEAAAQGHVAAVKEALDQGGNVHALDPNGNTALMLAAFDGHEAAARLLIERGAEVNAVNPRGRTALMFAATFNDPRTVQALLVNGAMVDVRDSDEKFTALMFAASEGHVDVVKLLLTHNADKSLVDVDGDSAADFARKNGHTKVVEALQ